MPRPKKTPEEIEEMRRRIIDAATELFREEGFDGMSIRKIADRLGVSHMVIYTYFKNRDALVDAFRDHMMTQMQFRHQEQLKRAEEEETLAVLRERLSKPIYTAHEHPQMFEVAWTRPLPAHAIEHRHSHMTHALEELAEIIGIGIRQGVCRDRDPRIAAGMAMCIVLGPQMMFVSGRLSEPDLRSALSEESLALAMAYLTGQDE